MWPWIAACTDPPFFYEMMTPFRPYKTKVDLINHNTGESSFSDIVINLFNVDHYSRVLNKAEGYKDNIDRTLIVQHNGVEHVAITKFEVFDKIMEEFYRDFQLYDDRTIRPILPDRLRYKGMMSAYFNQNKNEINAAFFRDGYEPTDFDDAMFNSLFKNRTPLN